MVHGFLDGRDVAQKNAEIDLKKFLGDTLPAFLACAWRRCRAAFMRWIATSVGIG